jgi:hypothetical protein
MKNEITRRKFMKAGSMAAVASGLGEAGAGTEAGRNFQAERVEVARSTYQVEVPETLDLAERAALSVNALTGVADPEQGYSTYLTSHLDQRPPYMKHLWPAVCLQKPIHALPMMRVMSGSNLRADYDRKMLEYVTRNIDDQGFLWLKKREGARGDAAAEEDQCWPVVQGRLIVALLDWHKYDGDPNWVKIVDDLSRGLAKIALRNDDRVWYHTAYRRTGWLPDETPSASITGAAGQHMTDSEPPKEIFFNIGLPLRAFSRWYAESGDRKALETAQGLARFMLKPAMWGTEEGPTMAVAAEHAFWAGHFHTHTMGMMGLLEYAIATNDAGLKEFVANFYEWGRNFGIGRIGFFPTLLGPLSEQRKWAATYGGPGATGVCDESCAVADMTWLAATLSESGVGDYWEDVDQYVRNHLVEHQMIRRDLLEEIVAAAPKHETDFLTETDRDVIERNIGAFASGSDPTMLYAWSTMCCNANSPVALYKAWSSIVVNRDGIAQVNLLLNRTSPWLDVDSYLPYEGKVVLKNKSARKAHVRVPLWAEKNAVRCRVNQKPLVTRWLNNYLLVDGLAPQDIVTIEFPVLQTVEKHADLNYGQEYTCLFRGNTLVDISPRAERPHYTTMGSDDGATFPITRGYPIYQRDLYKGNKAPMKKVQRYVSGVLI